MNEWYNYQCTTTIVMYVISSHTIYITLVGKLENNINSENGDIDCDEIN